jgi:hypothetical protein
MEEMEPAIEAFCSSLLPCESATCETCDHYNSGTAAFTSRQHRGHHFSAYLARLMCLTHICEIWQISREICNLMLL